MHFKLNIHNKNQTSTIKLIFPAHTMHITQHVAKPGLFPDRNETLVQLHIQHYLGYSEYMHNRLTVHNTTQTSTEKSNLNVAQKNAQCSTRPRRVQPTKYATFTHTYIYINLYLCT